MNIDSVLFSVKIFAEAMSTHAGFGTKKEEETYNQLVFNVLYLV